ncbi:hypothetical protein IC620_07835 [Hazenella sp. IB182357]|uniref:Peptidase MA-like domain-containing protein n=1 Tax=Polycladospora coralii TaxID=2771432 RepID=A0A926RT27_9BACL|nr:hypothetical protein [Polycladospora coralii]MBD1372270.1 hypothetical protein [Polycladospora coralii]MBS7531540.1 hypothetical protein [Polycladospora coralii]
MLRLLCTILIGLLMLGSFPEQTQAFDQQTEDEQQIVALVERKQQAVHNQKWSSYRKTIDLHNLNYVQEQKRWFDDAIKYMDPNTFRLQVQSIEKVGVDEYHVGVSETYHKNKRNHRINYMMKAVRTASGFKDGDFPFLSTKEDGITVKYMNESLEDQAHIALDTLKRAMFVFKQKFGWQPKLVEVKIYDRPEMFRHSVKMSLPLWAGGWHEHGESIKFIGGLTDAKTFAAGMVHELTHQMVSEMTRDNAAYWFQEGAAMYYEAHLLPGLHDDHPEQFTSLKVWSVPELEEADLEKLSAKDANRYYLSCYYWFNHLVNRVGEKKLQQIFEELANKPYMNQDSATKKDELNERTSQVLEHVVGW